jgi:hypothetical protein
MNGQLDDALDSAETAAAQASCRASGVFFWRTRYVQFGHPATILSPLALACVATQFVADC